MYEKYISASAIKNISFLTILAARPYRAYTAKLALIICGQRRSVKGVSKVLVG